MAVYILNQTKGCKSMIRSLLILVTFALFSTQASAVGSVAVNSKASGSKMYRFYFSDHAKQGIADFSAMRLCNNAEGQGNCRIYARPQRLACVAVSRKSSQGRVTKVFMQGAKASNPMRSSQALMAAKKKAEAKCKTSGPGYCSAGESKCFTK